MLAFDLRCHGSSGGQWAGLGDVERCDILGAVRWLKMIHPDECERIDGIGGGIAGAALIAAATDPSAQGQAIDAIAVFDTYAEVSSFAKSVADDRLAQPFRGWALNVMLPIASAHAGSDLKRFSPARLAPRLWPRPILVIHARGDRIVPFDQGLELFRTATFPKESLWLSGDHDDVYRNRQGAAEVLYFFDNARAVPAI